MTWDWTFVLVAFIAICMPPILGLLTWEEIQRRHLKRDLAQRNAERRQLDRQRFAWGERLIESMGALNQRVEHATNLAESRQPREPREQKP